MRNGMFSAALLCTLGPRSLLGGPKVVTSAARRSQAAAPFQPFQADLPLMPQLVPIRSTRTTDFYEVAIREGVADILPGFQTPIYGYEGIYPGPTIRARKGRTAVVKQTNTLPFDSNVHLHGGYVPAASDGHPMDVIKPGGVFDYTYPNDQDGAYLWYHDHAHGRTAKTLYYGLVGTYVLHDGQEEELGLPLGEYDVPLVIQDHAFNRDGSFRYTENVDVGFNGDTILVNGAVAPRMAVQRRKYRFRILNASNARGYRLALGRGRTMTQIASDGGLLERPVRRREVPIFPAERVELVIDFADFKPGTQLVLRNEGGEASTTAVMRFDVEGGGGAEEFRVPKRLDPALQAPVAERPPPARPQPGELVRRPVADQRARLRPGPRRLSPPARLDRDLAVHQPVQPRPPDAPARHAVPGAGAVVGRRAPGRSRLEGHDRRPARRARGDPAVVRALRRALRVPLPQPGARRQGDDAAAGGGQVRRSITLLLGSAVTLAAAAPAAAADVSVQGIGEIWSSTEVRIAAGDTVVWTFPNPDELHNVQADAPEPGTAAWTYATAPATPAVTGSYKFDTPGVYGFICAVHGKGMSGRVTVGNPPPPPPPPLSEQPFPNDSAITADSLETGGLDTTRPALRSVKAQRSGKRVRVSFRVSEQSVVVVRFSRGGKTVKTKQAAVSSRGSVTVAGLKPGRYAVRVRATDVAGNASSSRGASFRVR